MKCRDLKRKMPQVRVTNALCDCERVQVERVMQVTKKESKKKEMEKSSNARVTVQGAVSNKFKVVLKKVWTPQ